MLEKIVPRGYDSSGVPLPDKKDPSLVQYLVAKLNTEQLSHAQNGLHRFFVKLNMWSKYELENGQWILLLNH